MRQILFNPKDYTLLWHSGSRRTLPWETLLHCQRQVITWHQIEQHVSYKSVEAKEIERNLKTKGKSHTWNSNKAKTKKQWKRHTPNNDYLHFAAVWKSTSTFVSIWIMFSTALFRINTHTRKKQSRSFQRMKRCHTVSRAERKRGKARSEYTNWSNDYQMIQFSHSIVLIFDVIWLCKG